jgi:peroxiredoxin family protein
MAHRMTILLQSGDSYAFQLTLNAIAVGVSAEMPVTVLVAGWAAERLQNGRTNMLQLPAFAAGREDDLKTGMTKAGMDDPHAFLKKLKAAGDVQLFLCSQTPRVLGLDVDDLINEVDGQMGMTAFLLEHAANADVQLTF